MKRKNITKGKIFIAIVFFQILLTSKLTQAFISFPPWFQGLVIFFWILVGVFSLLALWALVALSIGMVKLVKKIKSRNQKDIIE